MPKTPINHRDVKMCAYQMIVTIGVAQALYDRLDMQLMAALFKRYCIHEGSLQRACPHKKYFANFEVRSTLQLRFLVFCAVRLCRSWHFERASGTTHPTMHRHVPEARESSRITVSILQKSVLMYFLLMLLIFYWRFLFKNRIRVVFQDWYTILLKYFHSAVIDSNSITGIRDI
jgi:hypothetical protein